MSAVATDGCSVPVFACVVAQPASGAKAGRRLLQREHSPLGALGRAVTGSEVVYKIASRREEFYAVFGLVYKAYVRAGLCAPRQLVIELP